MPFPDGTFSAAYMLHVGMDESLKTWPMPPRKNPDDTWEMGLRRQIVK